MSSGVDIGGDGSVAWRVWVQAVRRTSIVSKSEGGDSYLQSGVDETDPGQYFAIGIKVPRANGGELAKALFEAARDAEAHAYDPGYYVKFPLVIEPKNEDQISIRWESSATPLTAALGAKKALKKKSGKAAAKKAPRKAARTSAVKTAKKKAGKKR